ncbi:hypothetical protein LOTGIDRAFT_163413 [Lottia gigantea]|uniref:Uncharacterized protein n=1 Tax=Lottia gigantea TaxID=225164 RepID=V4BRY5_LOTGI|nr:hypothetical protein LOTGIDRAFT_163413 [Lottia gigantea]ESO91684.1 hypothetical protein LOTGIDRAFT_163413 [Lottia gigantea]
MFLHYSDHQLCMVANKKCNSHATKLRSDLHFYYSQPYTTGNRYETPLENTTVDNAPRLFAPSSTHNSSGDSFNYEDLSAMFDHSSADGSGTKGQDQILNGNSEKILCYRCGEDGGQTCDIDDLKLKPRNYLFECQGHCINISSPQFTVYTCVDEEHGGDKNCITNDVMTMCACVADYCNGPKGVIPIKEKKRLGRGPTGGATKKDIQIIFVFCQTIFALLLSTR